MGNLTTELQKSIIILAWPVTFPFPSYVDKTNENIFTVWEALHTPELQWKCWTMLNFVKSLDCILIWLSFNETKDIP